MRDVSALGDDGSSPELRGITSLPPAVGYFGGREISPALSARLPCNPADSCRSSPARRLPLGSRFRSPERFSSMTTRRLWLAFGAVIVASFLTLGYAGIRIYQQAPPVPDRIVTETGRDVVAPGDVAEGQNVWRSMGGMEVGAIWGPGSYV